jgi:hypothetical protein
MATTTDAKVALIAIGSSLSLVSHDSVEVDAEATGQLAMSPTLYATATAWGSVAHSVIAGRATQDLQDPAPILIQAGRIRADIERSAS